MARKNSEEDYEMEEATPSSSLKEVRESDDEEEDEEMSDASSETTEVDEGVEAVWQAVGEALRSLGTGSDQLPGYGRRFPGCTAKPLGQLFSFPNLKKAEGSLSATEQEEFCRRHAQVTEHLLSMLVNATRAQEKALAQLKGAQK